MEDKCGICDSNVDNDCIQDCNGDWGGNAVMDNCDVCDSNVDNDCIQDCNGDWGGNAVMDNCGVCDGDDSNCSGHKEPDISKNEKLKAAQIYLEQTRKNINTGKTETKTNKSFYYMITGGLSNEEGKVVEYESNYELSVSILGFYGKIKPNALLGFNQTVRAVNIDDDYYLDDYYYGDDYDFWRYDRLYGLSYIQFNEQIGKGWYWRIDIGYAENEVVNISDSSNDEVIADGKGMMIGYGVALNNNVLIEFDYHYREYENLEYNWFAISVGGLF